MISQAQIGVELSRVDEILEKASDFNEAIDMATACLEDTRHRHALQVVSDELGYRISLARKQLEDIRNRIRGTL